MTKVQWLDLQKIVKKCACSIVEKVYARMCMVYIINMFFHVIEWSSINMSINVHK
jgi:hypothetical protein